MKRDVALSTFFTRQQEQRKKQRNATVQEGFAFMLGAH